MSVKYAHKVRVFKRHRLCWTWNHRGNHKGRTIAPGEGLSHLGSAYGPLYNTFAGALEGALTHAKECVCEGR